MDAFAGTAPAPVRPHPTTEAQSGRARSSHRQPPCDQAPRPLATALFALYRYRWRSVRAVIRRLVERLEGGEVFSQTLRRIFAAYHGVEIGQYSHGACFIPGNFPPGTSIGRYCSIAVTASAFNANHPMNLRSSHALFFNPELGFAEELLITRGRIEIGNDVWIGHNAILLPSVSSVGDGAVIGAGAVVNKNVPPYAVVTGNPCRIVRYRFSKAVIAELLASQWWKKSLKELQPEFWRFQQPLEEGRVR